MNKGWLIGIIIFLIIAGSIGSAYMLRSVGSLSIDLEAVKASNETYMTSVDGLVEQVAALEEQQKIASEKLAVMESDNAILKEKLTYVGEQLVAIPGVITRFGAIRDMEAGNGFVSFEIDLKAWLTGEAAMTYLIDEFGLTIEEAMSQLPNGYYIQDLPDEPIIYKLDKSAFIKLIAESEQYESDLGTLINLVAEFEEFENYPMFTFFVVDREIIQVEEQYIP